MPTPRKAAMLKEIEDRMGRASVLISADYRGLSVAQMTKLRRALRPADVELTVVKNTIASMAANNVGHPEMAELLNGPSAIAFGMGDPVAPAKALADYLRDERLELTVHGGWLEGRILSPAEVQDLATLPSKDQMIADVVAKLQGPLYNFSGLLQSTIRNFAGLVDARANQLEESGEAA
jgi:large subunit ribosomal protein L10